MTRFFVSLFVIILLFLPYSHGGYNVNDASMYDKPYILERFGGDITGDLSLFPDDLGDAEPVSYTVHLVTDLFDTDGYIVFRCRYDADSLEKEVERMKKISCSLDHNDKVLTKTVLYDEEQFYFPAYVAIDGYDSEYEYALIDRDSSEIIYVYLSAPEFQFRASDGYLKKDLSSFIRNDPLKGYSMYSFYFEDGQYWLEPGDIS